MSKLIYFAKYRKIGNRHAVHYCRENSCVARNVLYSSVACDNLTTPAECWS